MCTHYNCLIEVILMSTCNITLAYFIEDRKDIPKLSPFASWPGAMISSPRLKAPGELIGQWSISHPPIVSQHLWLVISPHSAGWSQSFLIYSMPLVEDWWCKLFMEIQWKPWLLWQPQGSIDLQWKILVITITPQMFWSDVPGTCR